MLKNSKMLKGVIIALAFVLVLGGGVLLKAAVDAAAKTVIFYVSDDGDNTAGKDVSTAFTSIGDALKKANEMKLDPGMKLRLVIADTVSISTQYIDNNIVAKDNKGGKLPVTVTSLHDDSDDNMSTIYLTYVQASNLFEDGSQRAYVVNDFTFKDVRIQAKVHSTYVAGNGSSGNKDNLYRIRYFRVVNSNVVFDNCHLTSDLGDTVPWTILGDNMTATDAKRDTFLTIKNRDLSHVKVHLVEGAICPNYSVYFHGENVKLAEFYILKRTTTTETQDVQKVEANFKNCTLGNLYLSSSGGHLTVADGVVVNAENTEILKMAGSSSTPTVCSDVTYNFTDCVIHGHEDLSKMAFFAPKGKLYGDITLNIKDTDFAVTSGSIYAVGNGGKIYGNVYNNISGNSKFNMLVGGNYNEGDIDGSIYTNIEDATVGGNFFGGNYNGGSVISISNTVKKTNFKANLYFGGRKGTVRNNVTTDISDSSCTTAYFGNNVADFGEPNRKISYRVKSVVKDCTFLNFYGGSASSSITAKEEDGKYANGTVETYLSGDITVQYFYGGGGGGKIDAIKTVFDSKITYSKPSDPITCGGSNSGDVGSIHNIIEDGADLQNFMGANNGGGRIDSVTTVVNGGKITDFIGGGRNAAANIGIIKNFFTGGTIVPSVKKVEGKDTKTSVYLGNSGTATKDNTPKVETIENVFGSADFSATGNAFCGSKDGIVVNSITNVFEGNAGKVFKGGDWFFGGNDGAKFADPTVAISCRIKNVLSNADFIRFVGSSASAVEGAGALGTVENYFGNGLYFDISSYGGGYNNKVNTVKNLIDGKVTGTFICGGSVQADVDTIQNIIESGADITAFHGTNNNKGKVGSVVNLVKGGKIQNFHGGGRNVPVETDSIKNYFYGGSVTENAYCAGDRGVSPSVENYFYGTNFKNLYGGAKGAKVEPDPNDPTKIVPETAITSIKNHFNGGTVSGVCYGGSGINKVTSIENLFEATKFTGESVYGGNKDGALDRVQNLFKSDISKAGFVCGGSASGEVKTVSNNIVKGAKIASFYGNNNSDGAGTVDTVVNTLSGGSVGNFVGGGNGTFTLGSVKNNFIKGNVTGDVFCGSIDGTVNALNSYFIGANFSGKDVYCASDKGTANANTMIAGGIFTCERINPMNKSSATGTFKLEIRPDASEDTLFFDFAIPAKGSSESFYGLANQDEADVYIYGTEKPIYIGSRGKLCADIIRERVTLIQKEEWINGEVYIVLPTDASGNASKDMIRYVSADQVTGSALFTRKDGVFFAPGSKMNKNVLIGSSSAPTLDKVPAAPKVEGVGFTLDSQLLIDLYTSKESVEKQIDVFGKFTYKLSFMGDVIGSGEITDIYNADVVGNKVRFSCVFDIPATKFGETVTITLGGEDRVYTVYQLLEIAADAASSAEEENLIKAIFNYGVEAEKLTGEASTGNYYDGISYFGSYRFDATASSMADGFAFNEVGLSLDENVCLDFYLNAASAYDLTFKATKANGAQIPASLIKVKYVQGEGRYNVVVSVKLDILSAGEKITLTAYNGSGAAVATVTNSVTSTCAYYIQNDAKYEKVASALLAYFEKAQEYKA